MRAPSHPAFLCLVLLTLPGSLSAQTNATDPVAQRLKNLEESLSFLEQRLEKRVNDVLWYHQLGEVAIVDKVRYTGPPPRVIRNPTGQGASNDIIVAAYTFLPRKFSNEKLPLLVLVHGGVHGDVDPAGEGRIVRELVDQGYAVIAPDYRGSTGYGRDYWRLIDYGGLENEDVLAGKKWMLEHHPNLDTNRVGILGWSHGGM